MNNLFTLLSFVVYAAELVVSPLADELPTPPAVTKPVVSFAQLANTTVDNNESVLGQSTPSSTPTPTATPPPRTTRKNKFTIAALGDSMIDTLGPQLPQLKSLLGQTYPSVQFTLLNYGVGGTNIDYAAERITSDYLYLGQRFPSLVSQFPDLVIVESMAYNPYSFDEGALDKHWLALAKIVDLVKQNLPNVQIIIAASIAPNANVFGDGAPGLANDAIGKWQKVNTIKKYLDNAVKFARSQNLPLADAFHPSLDALGNGKEKYINPGDHIHYSDAGREFFSKILLETIISHRLLE